MIVTVSLLQVRQMNCIELFVLNFCTHVNPDTKSFSVNFSAHVLFHLDFYTSL